MEPVHMNYIKNGLESNTYSIIKQIGQIPNKMASWFKHTV